MNYNAVIFDLDGTLLDTLEDLALSVNTVLKRKGFDAYPVDDYRYFVGEGIEMLVKKAFPVDNITEKEFNGLVIAVKEEYSRRWADHTKPYPGIPELLDFLEEKKVPKAIFSNKPHEFAMITVETLLPRWKFTDVCGLQPGIPRKPEPLGALQIVEKMQLQPNQIVYLGDTVTDMHTAVSAGFYPVGALWGFRSREELIEGGAKMLAESPLELTNLFK
ncbi:MAG: HAD family hydrolase [Bacillota bacterium]